MKSFERYVLAFILSFFLSTAQAEEPLSELHGLYVDLRAYNVELISRPEGFDLQALVNKYHELEIGRFHNVLSDLSDDDLLWLYRSVSTIVFYDPESRLSENMDAVFAELDKRGALQEEQVRSYYFHLIRAGRLDDAETFSQAYVHIMDKALPAIPQIVDGADVSGKGLSVLRVSSPDLPLVRDNIRLHDNVTIIIQFHPNCAMASALMNQIAGEETWKRFFTERAYLLAANPTNILDVDALHDWNESSPFEVFLIDDRSDWPFIDQIATPSFYLLREGEEVESFTGYTAETLERLAEVMSEVKAEPNSSEVL